MHRIPLLVLTFLVGWLAARAAWFAPALAAGGPPDFADVVAAVDAGIVHVTTILPGDRAPASRDDAVGAGFVVSDGLVVTSRHVIQGAQRVRVDAGRFGSADAQVLGADDATDVALLRVPLAGLVPVRAGDPARLRVGQWVLAAGSPYHLAHSWSVGIVSGLHRSRVGVSLRGYEDFIQTDAAANVGNSGGPLVDAQGEVVGMVTAILTRTGSSQGVSLAVPIDAVLATVRSFTGGGPVERPGLGAVVRETVLPGGAGGGLEVTRFPAGSPAAAAGLRAGDVVVEVDGVATPRTADLQRSLWSKPAGTRVTVVFVRDGQRLQLPVTIR